MAVLAMIARAGPRGISRDRLRAALWPDAAEESGRHALKQALYALRRDAGVAEPFLGTRELRLNPDEVSSDVTEFEDLRQRGQHARAAAVCEGPFLEGFRLASVPEFEYWMEEEREALQRALADTLAHLARTAREAGDPAGAVLWSRRMVALDPLNARLTLDLMTALLAAGDRAGALQQARVYESLIAQQLDLPPDPGIVGLTTRIREGTVLPAAVAVEPAVATPASALPSHPIVRSSMPDLAVAVLPFAYLPLDADSGLLADGLTEETISALGRLGDLSVVGRMPHTLIRDDAPDLAAIAERFGVTAAIEGSVRRGNESVRITVRLLRVRDGRLLWTERYDREPGNPLALQDNLARAIALGVQDTLRRAAGLPPAPTARERADELYTRGTRAWTPQSAGLGEGLEYFRQALALDPEHARAHAALAESYTQLAFYGFLPAPRAATLVDAAAREAMRLAPELAESHLARGTSLLWVDREFAAGIVELERALAIDPRLVVAQARLAFVRLCHDGPADPGRAGAERAATVTGATGLSRVMYGQQLLAAGRLDEAIDALHAAIDIEAPHFLAYHWLVAAYVRKGRGADAVAAAVAEASLSDRHPWSLMSLVVACATAGQMTRARTLLDTLTARAESGYVQASILAQAHAAVGDLDGGVRLLERAVEERDPSMMMLKTFPMFAVFRPHPSFPSLLHRAGWRD
jgi:TolB-like protein/Tfp pilus assembly protein PilF